MTEHSAAFTAIIVMDSRNLVQPNLVQRLKQWPLPNILETINMPYACFITGGSKSELTYHLLVKVIYN